ncbi:protein MIGRI [Paludibacterium paludis]|uniref:Uncharacterized protein n=1 Tax=Paludibacterium paludis TaxID=1225769 RepID=A0A918P3A6_9NEIS|nr:hypothetical protein [Paludibacterium paludis]GGY16699.1 hypothetical protein GCM10011289_20060 [Paludibacterium paludis]
MGRFVKWLLIAALAVFLWNLLRHRAYRHHVHTVFSRLAMLLLCVALGAILLRLFA